MNGNEPHKSTFEKLDRINSERELDSPRFRLLEAIAPGQFYRWPAWKKVALAILVVAVLAGLVTLKVKFYGPV